MSEFPIQRMRRLRMNPAVRRLVQQTQLRPSNFIMPLFVRSGEGIRQPISSMPGQYQFSIDQLLQETQKADSLGVGGVILFGIPDSKDPEGAVASHDQGIVQEAIRAIKSDTPNSLVITDLCFCEYTDHGHCGILTEANGQVTVDNDLTLPGLGVQAVSHVQAGADLIAPSGMMDGMVGAIRSALDGSGFRDTPIMSYAAKYSSAYYGPFRDAAESAPESGDRKTYQMDPAAAAAQALREVELDLQEGADMIMVKPALAYLDIITRVSQAYPGVPLAAYNVSGEYSMIKAAVASGWLDEQRVVMETMTAIRRAGAEIILTYWAIELAEQLASC